MALISLADQDGHVDMTVNALTSLTGWPQTFIERGLRELEAPDPESRSPDSDGRRIERLRDNTTWGWRVVNYLKYRDIRDETSRREYMKKYMRERRCKQDVNTCKHVLTQLAHADADADTDTEKERHPSGVQRKSNGAARPTATRLPDDFDLNQTRRDYALAQGVDPDRTFENFRDYWNAASGAKARKHDWGATWRMWCRSESARAGPGTKIKRRAKTVAELEAEETERNAKHGQD